jgi:glycolate oxidase FAD binding subunit
LGLLTEVTLKTVPLPRAEHTLRFEMDQPQALESMARWATRPLPLSATAWHESLLHVRLSGSEAAVRTACATLGGESVSAADEFWGSVREQRLAFFASARELWRLSLPAHSPGLPLSGPTLIEWGGALRWLTDRREGSALHALARRFGGHATLYRAAVKPPEGPFQPLLPNMLSVHRRLKAAFDPHGIFNRGRLYPQL